LVQKAAPGAKQQCGLGVLSTPATIASTSRGRVLKLYLPFAGHRFRSRYAYRLGYAVQREDACGKAQRRSRKIYRKLGADPYGPYPPEKPPRMGWATYERFVGNLIAARRVADERLMLAARRRGACHDAAARSRRCRADPQHCCWSRSGAAGRAQSSHTLASGRLR
jgi:hypothetical protein